MPRSAKHIAGIITVSGIKDNFKFPWHPCLMPVGENYLAIEYAAMCAVYAGCETIWIMCEPHLQKIIKKRLGDYINDNSNVDYSKNWDNQKAIPIFYIAVPDKDVYKDRSYDWNMMTGALIAEKVSNTISKHVVPDQYLFICPYLVIPEQFYGSAKLLMAEGSKIKCKPYDNVFDPGFPLEQGRLPFSSDIDEIKQYKEIYDNRSAEAYHNNLSKPEIREIINQPFFFPLDESPHYVIQCSSCWEITDWDRYSRFQYANKTRPKVITNKRSWKRFVCEDLKKEQYKLTEEE